MTVKASTRERLAHETREIVMVFLFVAPFCLSFEAYRMYLQGELDEPLVGLSVALVNALVLSKIVLLGEMAHLGERRSNRPLFLVTIHKSAVFTIFYLLFHLLERGIHGLRHGESFLEAVRTAAVVHGGGLALHFAFVFFAFIPFFALREGRLVIGEERFHQLFLGSGPDAVSHEGGHGTRLQPRPH